MLLSIISDKRHNVCSFLSNKGTARPNSPSSHPSTCDKISALQNKWQKDGVLHSCTTSSHADTPLYGQCRLGTCETCATYNDLFPIVFGEHFFFSTKCPLLLVLRRLHIFPPGAPLFNRQRGRLPESQQIFQRPS